MHKRKVLYNIYKLKNTEADLARYKAQRNGVVTLIRESKEDFFRNLTPQYEC